MNARQLHPWLYGVTFLLASALANAAGPSVFINEFHYDNTGTDAGEFIEIAGPAGTDLSTYWIELYSGGGTVYGTTALAGVIPNQQNGMGTLAFPYAVNGIQNGPADGFALIDSGTVLQLLSYEGAFTATVGTANGMASTDVGVLEDGMNALGTSLQLQGMGRVYSDFTWAGPLAHTQDLVNLGQTFLVPEPETYALMLAGLALLGFVARRRRLSVSPN